MPEERRRMYLEILLIFLQVALLLEILHIATVPMWCVVRLMGCATRRHIQGTLALVTHCGSSDDGQLELPVVTLFIRYSR